MSYKQLILIGMVASIFTGCFSLSTHETDLNMSSQKQILSSNELQIVLNPEYPVILSYSFAGEKMTVLDNGIRTIKLNNTEYTPKIFLKYINANHAVYNLEFSEIKVVISLNCSVQENVVTWKITDVIETGDFMVRHINIPGLVLLSAKTQNNLALGNFPAASYASNKAKDMDFIGNAGDLKLTNKEIKNKEGKVTSIDSIITNGIIEFKTNNDNQFGASYAFVSNGKIAAGIYSNVMTEDTRILCKQTKFKKETDTLMQLTPGTWSWRENPPAIIEDLPETRIIFAKNLNNDKKIDWQDAAIAFRKAIPVAYGSQVTPYHPISYIAMNFGSQATFPFLRVLDNAKKIWLYTDGLAQRIQYKGFAGEGHDSSHPDYAGNVGRRMGGRKDLNFVMNKGHDFNILSGIHINAHEYHTESKEFKPSLIGLNIDPKNFKPEMLKDKKVAWCWLDESYPTDYRRDATSGEVEARLRRLREDLPYLDFNYLDVYYGRGWPAYNMHKITNQLGIIQHTEFPGVMERAVIWNHVSHDWTQAIWGKGDQSGIARFIFNAQKDTFGHNPLLRGANCSGFMGWHGEHNMLQTIASTFTINLPTKYLQNFELLSLTDNLANFSNGVYSKTTLEKNGRLKAEIFNQDGNLINRCYYQISLNETEKNSGNAFPLPWSPTVVYKRCIPTENLCFIPWNPKTADKIFHWNDIGGNSTWTLPQQWHNLKTVVLYRLTDTGRVFQETIKVFNGKIKLNNILAKTPYVIYPQTAPILPEIKWGEGGLVCDPGFDSHSFTSWKPSSTETIQIENDQFGQTMLTMNQKGKVEQVIENLTPGQTYALSVWTNIEGKQESGIEVSNYIPTLKTPDIDKSKWQIISSTKSSNPAEMLLDYDPTTIWHTIFGKKDSDFATFPHHFTIKFEQTYNISGFILTAREKCGNGSIKTYDAEVSMDNQNWTKISSGTFQYQNEKATIKFPQTVQARYFRLTAKEEVKGQKFSSAAEFDIIGTVAQNKKIQTPTTTILAKNSIDCTILPNYTDQSAKYKRPWHRLKVIFTAPENGKAVIRLFAGEKTETSKVHFDDVRLVETKISKPANNIEHYVLFEDFENVDEGWGPFMYGWQGPMNTHLSETNLPYTDDTIQGEFSLKTRREMPMGKNGFVPSIIYRTVPATLKLKPNTSYRISFDYKSRDTNNVYQFIAGTEQNPKATTITIEDSQWEVKNFSTVISTDQNNDWFIGIFKNAEVKEKIDNFIIDNLLITEEK